MDGFVRAASVDRQTVDRSVMGYYDDRDLPFYWNVADEYVLFDRFFAATPDGSVASHMFWVTGTPGDPDGGFGDRPTIFDRLDERGISWKFYVEDYDPRQATQAVRVPLLNSARYVERSEALRPHRGPRRVLRGPARRHACPRSRTSRPPGSSEHPPGRIEAGEALVKRLITALSMSSAWDSSAFMWTYDDWGGWFDHVRPPRVAGGTLGFRVPALLVSPYAAAATSTAPGSTPPRSSGSSRTTGSSSPSRGETLEPTASPARSTSREPPRAPSIVAAERGPRTRPRCVAG